MRALAGEGLARSLAASLPARTRSWRRWIGNWRSARVLWESHRQQQRDPAESGAEWLDELLRDKAHGSLEYVFTLLSLIHDRAPLMAAFRSLAPGRPAPAGTALEYLEGILPAKTREMLWEILQERPSRAAGRSKGEIMQDLLKRERNRGVAAAAKRRYGQDLGASRP